MGVSLRPDLDETPQQRRTREEVNRRAHLDALATERRSLEERGREERVVQIDAELARALKGR